MEKIFDELAKGIGQVGALGIFGLLGWGLYLYFTKHQQPVAVLARDEKQEREMQQPTTQELRDKIRDTDYRTIEIKKNTEQELGHLASLVTGVVRLAEISERIEEKQAEHDRWVRENAQNVRSETRSYQDSERKHRRRKT